jgi:hypothetical protein
MNDYSMMDLEVVPTGIAINNESVFNLADLTSTVGGADVTLSVSATAANTGTAIHNFAIGVSIINQSLGFAVDLPWRKLINVAVGTVMSYSSASWPTPTLIGLKAGTYDAVCRVWSTYTGGTLVSGTTDYYTGGTLGNGSGTDYLDEMKITGAFTVSVDIKADIITFTITRAA